MMGTLRPWRLVFVNIVFLYGLLGVQSVSPVIVYDFASVDFDWPNSTIRQRYEAEGSYNRDSIGISGVRFYKDRTFVTSQRFNTGVPSTVSEIKRNSTRENVRLVPFPNWEIHKSIRSCDQIQFVEAMEIDPNTGWMWMVDTGYNPRDAIRPIGEPSCQAKLIIYDIEQNIEVHRHLFPKLVTGYGKFYLKDMVLDFVEGRANYAYITDAHDWKIIVYDHALNLSYTFVHPSMDPEPGFVNITKDNRTENIKSLGISGIAISSDFSHVFYSAFAGVNVYKIPTTVLRSFRHDTVYFTYNVKKHGTKLSFGDGMYISRDNNMFYSALGLADSAIIKWPLGDSTLAIYHVPLFSDQRFEWISSLTIDQSKHLWFINRDVKGGVSDDNTLWKVYVNEKSYMNFSVDSPVQASNNLVPHIHGLFISLLNFVVIYTF